MTTRQPRIGRAAADRVGDAAEQDRADRHADELHRQHDAERGAVDAPLRGDARRGEADRQHVEAVERVQGDRDAHDEHLQGAHRRVAEHVAWISSVHGSEAYDKRGRPYSLNSLAAFSLRISGRTSSLIAIFSKSAIQRSGVSIG